MTGALDQLAQMQGEDVDQALLSVVKQGSSAERRAVLPRLVKAGNPEALQLAIDLASKGSRNERYEAMRMLGDAGTPKAFDALLDIAGKSRGQTRVQALEHARAVRTRAIPRSASCSPTRCSPAAARRRTYAASVLGRIGTEDARQALVAALTGKDKEPRRGRRRRARPDRHDRQRRRPRCSSAARDNPQVKMQVMQQLVQAGAPEGLRLAEEMLERQGLAGAASQAVWALAQQRHAPRRKRLLERALDSKDPSVRMRGDLGARPEPRRPLDRHAAPPHARQRSAGARDGALDARPDRLERAQQAIIDATRIGKPEDRVAAISGLASMDDARASQQLARLMRDSRSRRRARRDRRRRTTAAPRSTRR